MKKDGAADAALVATSDALKTRRSARRSMDANPDLAPDHGGGGDEGTGTLDRRLGAFTESS